MQLRDDEQRETPPKRPFYWWNHFRQANGGFPVGSKDKERHLGKSNVGAGGGETRR